MAYTLTYTYDSSTTSYIVDGYTGTPTYIAIPETYNDGINGVHNVSGIGFDAFRNCNSLTQATIPDTITSIDEGAFRSCSNLIEVNLLGTSPAELSADVFLYTSAALKLYCFQNSLALYKTATGWIAFENQFIADDVRLYFVMNSISTKKYFATKSESETKQDKLTQSTDLTPTTQTLTLTANTRYALGTLTALDLTFPASGNDGDEIIVEFVSGSTATTLTLDNVNAIYNFTSVGADKFVELNAQYKVSVNKWVVYSAETDYTVV